MWVRAITCCNIRQGLCPEVCAICFSCVRSWKHLNWVLQQPMPGKSVYRLTFSCAPLIISSPVFIPAIFWSTRYHLDAPGRLQPEKLGENSGNVFAQNCHFPYFGWNVERWMTDLKIFQCCYKIGSQYRCCSTWHLLWVPECWIPFFFWESKNGCLYVSDQIQRQLGWAATIHFLFDLNYLNLLQYSWS